MNNDIESDKIIRFVKDHPDIFLKAISLHYPLSIGFIERNADFLDWDCLMENVKIVFNMEFCKKFRHRINWMMLTPGEFEFYTDRNYYNPFNAEFLEEFKNELDWSRVSYRGTNELLTDEIIEKYQDRIYFSQLSANYFKVFSNELILKYEDKWDWFHFSRCKNLPWSYEFIQRYLDKWDWYYLQFNFGITWTQDILDLVGDYLNPNRLEAMQKYILDTGKPYVLTSPKDIFRSGNINNSVYTKEEFAEILGKFNPAKQSSNTRIPWSSELIEYYKEEWNWRELSENRSVTFTEELIDKYLSGWFWGKETPTDEPDECGILTYSHEMGLSNNENISWTPGMIHKYKDYIFWDFFIYNDGIQWTFDLLIKYYTLIDPDEISRIPKLWEMVFFPYLDEDIISGILQENASWIEQFLRAEEDNLEFDTDYYIDMRDGNTYKLLTIGDQVWMTENFRYIPHVCPHNENGGIWVYGYKGSDIKEARATDNYNKYGCLYDWNTAMSLCPEGWHLPTDEEWTVLINQLGGPKIAGEKLKSIIHWQVSKVNATNESLFSALPGGKRFISGEFGLIKQQGAWWSSTNDNSDCAWIREMAYSNNRIYRMPGFKEGGLSVRLIKDKL